METSTNFYNFKIRYSKGIHIVKDQGKLWIGYRINRKRIGRIIETGWADNRCEGNYQDDCIHGFGIFTLENGDKIFGKYVKGYLEYGCHEYPNGDKYIGLFNKSDKKHEFGTYFYSYGDLYQGEFNNNDRQGSGEYIWRDGRFFEGQWRNDVEHGSGIFTDQDGLQWKQQYHNGRMFSNVRVESGE